MTHLMTRRHVITAALASMALPARAGTGHRFEFPSIDGGAYDLSAYAGQPVMVVNTASQCAFTPQYDALQALYDDHKDAGLVILAVPSDDFGSQELEDEAAVKEFCELNYNLTLPMTTIQRVRGMKAHPFYRWAASEGVRPRWNFHKILLDGEGRIVADFASGVRPSSAAIRRALAPLLS